MSSKCDGNKLKMAGERLELRKEFVYSSGECADLLRLSPRIIRASIERGELGASKIAGRFVITGPDVFLFLKKMRVYRRGV